MDNTKQNKMGTAPVLKLIISMSLPAMFSMLIQSLYNIVDSIFVAQIGEAALTAVSLAFPIQMLMISVAVGTGVGLNSLISRRLGEGRGEEANQAADHGVILAVASWAIFLIFGLFFVKPFFQAFTNNPVVYQMGVDYLEVVSIFSIGVFVEVAVEKMLQATGNMIYPMVFQLIGAVCNIILDPIMIFGLLGFPALGVKGAAVATVVGQIIAMLYSLYVLFFKKHDIKVDLLKFRPRLSTIKDVYAVGFPSIIMQSIGSVLTMGLNGILIGFSEAAVSVLGVYYKLQSFVFMPVFGLTHGVMPIMGYNYGARNKKRLLEALKFGTIIAFGIMIVGVLIFMLLTPQMLMIFNASPEMMEIGVPALRIICTCFPFAAIGILFSTLFQAVGDGVKSLIISILRQLVLILPAAYLFARFIGLQAVWFAFPIAESCSFLVSAVFCWMLYNKKIKNLDSFAPDTPPELPQE